MRSAAATLTGAGDAERVRTYGVTRSFFDVVYRGRPAALGRVLDVADADEGRPVIVISHGLWLRRFGGDPQVIGRTVALDGIPVSVVGVLPASFAFPENCEVWRPYVLTPRLRAQQGSWFLDVVARLRTDATITQAQAEIDAITAQLAAQFPARRKDRGAWVIGLQEDLGNRVEDALWVLQGVVGVVLLVACANVANLLIVSASGRRRELNIRASLGAGTGPARPTARHRESVHRHRRRRGRRRRRGLGRAASRRERTGIHAARESSHRDRSGRAGIHDDSVPRHGPRGRHRAGAAVLATGDGVRPEGRFNRRGGNGHVGPTVAPPRSRGRRSRTDGRPRRRIGAPHPQFRAHYESAARVHAGAAAHGDDHPPRTHLRLTGRTATVLDGALRTVARHAWCAGRWRIDGASVFELGVANVVRGARPGRRQERRHQHPNRHARLLQHARPADPAGPSTDRSRRRGQRAGRRRQRSLRTACTCRLSVRSASNFAPSGRRAARARRRRLASRANWRRRPGG